MDALGVLTALGGDIGFLSGGDDDDDGDEAVLVGGDAAAGA